MENYPDTFENNVEVSVPAIIHLPHANESDHGRKAFIEANTIPATLDELRSQHIIPVFSKDNEPLISQSDFIQIANEVAHKVFHGESILSPAIRLSHPVKGRIPEARLKPASDLEDWEKTLYYERMAFVIEIPSISSAVEENPLSLMIGGVKSYHLDNLSAKKGSDEHFKVFIGFQNKVCTNLCIWTDGYFGDLKVKNVGMLKSSIRTLFESYNHDYHLFHLRQLAQQTLTERQFATLLGRCRMYNHLPFRKKSDIPQLLFGENQISAICKDYYQDQSFCRGENGDISLWRLYNLFTSANKSTYIDQFSDRSVNASTFVEQIRWGLEGKKECWYLH